MIVYLNTDTGSIDTKEGWLEDWKEIMDVENEIIDHENEKLIELDENAVIKELYKCTTAEEFWEECIKDGLDVVNTDDYFDSVEGYKCFKEDDVNEDDYVDDFSTLLLGDFRTSLCEVLVFYNSEKKEIKTKTEKWIVRNNDDWGEYEHNTDILIKLKEDVKFDLNDGKFRIALALVLNEIIEDTLKMIDEQNEQRSKN